MLHLRVLGGLVLVDEAGSLPREALQKRRLALLALLAVGEKNGLSRDLVQCYLWPESPEPRARHALDQLVYGTRRSLGSEPILTRGPDLRLNPATITTDVREFGNAVAEQRWCDAAAVYKGPLLQGFHLADSVELESWIDTERARLHAQFQDALESLARMAANNGDFQGATRWWTQLSKSDPLCSRFAAETVKSFISAGDPARAIQHARSYQELVRTDLGVEPNPAVEKIIAELPPPEFTRPRAHALRSVSRSPEEQSAIAAPGGDSVRPRVRESSGQWRTGGLTLLLVAAAAAAAVVAMIGFYEHANASGSATRVAAALPADAAAKEHYLKGVNFWNDRSKAALDSAVVYFRKAIEEEPGFSGAHAGLANAYVMIGYSGYRSSAAMFPKAKAAALRSIDLDSTLAAPYAALGMEMTWERKFDDAEAAFAKALRLDPSYATAHQWHGILLMILSRTAEAVAETRRAAELDPLSLQIQNNYGSFLSASGQKKAALQHYQKVVGDEPDSAWVRRNPWLLTNMASVYAANGQYAKALGFARRSVEILPGHPRAVSALANVYYRMGNTQEARRVFATADTLNEHYPAYRAFMYVTEGQPDSAFAWFDKVHDWGIPVLISLPGLRTAKTIADDPRLPALFRRIGLPYVQLKR